MHMNNKNYMLDHQSEIGLNIIFNVFYIAKIRQTVEL